MCRLCSTNGKECKCRPEWIVPPKRINMRLADPIELRCGQTELRSDGELVALCEGCLRKSWEEMNPVIIV
jgi:hypothetical protein